MCGLVAFITKKNNGFDKEQVDAFDNLLYIDALRGMDSTGVFVVDRSGSMDLAKEASASFYYRQDHEYKKLLTKAFQSGRALVGHNRAATKGEVVDENAHPFVVDDRITLCHNGTLWGDFRQLTKQKVEVDSHAIAHKIHEKGDDVEAALQEVNGAYALIWHDFKHNTLNFVRNAQRPLHWVEVKDGWIWASEANMIEWILARYDFKPIDSVSPLEAGTLVTYDFKNESWKVDNKTIKLEAPKPHYVPPTFPNNHHVSMRGRMHPYVNGYYNLDGLDEHFSDDDEYIAPAKPICELPEPTAIKQGVDSAFHKVQQQNSSVVRTQISNNGQVVRIPSSEQSSQLHRVVSYEQKMMYMEGINSTPPAFMEPAQEIKDGTEQLGECFDFVQILEDKPEGGWFIYAYLTANTNWVVKVYMSGKKWTEKDLMDLTINSRVCLFKIQSRQWRSYNDASRGIGYGMFMANGFQELEDVEAVEVETKDKV